MIPIDIHTHRTPSRPGEAIVSTTPDAFSPQPGGYYSVGIHPWHTESDKTEMDRQRRLLRTQAHHTSVVAIGEAGLDKLKGAGMEVQTALFVEQARLAEEVGKPLIVHQVRAVDELLAVHRTLRPSMPWVIHGFRGGAEQAAQLQRRGLYLSFGCRFNSESLCRAPADRLLIETDDSDCSLDSLCAHVAFLRHMEPEELCLQLRENVQKLFFHEQSLAVHGKSCTFVN